MCNNKVAPRYFLVSTSNLIRSFISAETELRLRLRRTQKNQRTEEKTEISNLKHDMKCTID